MADAIADAYVRLRPKADSFKADTNKLLGGISFGGAAKATIGIVGVTSALAALTQGVKSVVLGGAAFETEINTFQAVTQATTAQMQLASSAAVKLGQDVKLPGVSAADAAVAMTELAKGGLDVTDSLAGVRGALELGTAANTDFATSAQVIARNLSAFELAGDQASRVADLLAGASIAATGEVVDMAIALSQSATVAHTAGLSIDDTVTAIAQLAKAGLVGSDAGTSLRTMLLRLVPSTQKAANKMAELGVKVLDAQGDLLPFPKIIESYKKALEGMSESQRIAALNVIFGQDAIRSASIFARGGAKAFADVEKVTTKLGQANVLTTARTKGLGGSLGALKSNLETIAIQISGKVNPSIKRFVDFINRGLGGAPAALQGIREAFQLGGVTGGLDKIRETFEKLSPGAKVATFAVAGLTIAVGVLVATAFPITTVVLAIAALAIGFKLAYDRSARFRDIIDRLKANVMEAGPAFQQLRATVASELAAIEVFIRRLADVWSVAGHRIEIVVKQAFGTVVRVIENYFGIIQGIFDTFTGVLTGDWSLAWDGVKKTVSSALGVITSIVRGWHSILFGVFQGIWKSLEEEALRGIEAILKVMNKIPSIKVKGVGFTNPAKEWLEHVQEDLANIRSSRAAKEAAQAAEEIAEAFSRNAAAALDARNRDITEAVEGVIDNAVVTVKPVAKGGGAEIGTTLGDGMNAAISVSGQNAIDNLKERLADAIKTTNDQVRDAVLGAQRNLASLGSGLSSQLQTIIDEGPLGVVVRRLTEQLSGSQAKTQAAALQKAIADAQADLVRSRGQIANPGSLDAAQQASVARFLMPKKEAVATAKKAWADFQTQTVIGGIQARQAQQKKTVEKQVNDLVTAFNSGALGQGPKAAETFQKRLGGILEGQSKAFKIAGATLGTSFATGFNQQVAGLLLQAQAIQKGRNKGLPSLLGQGGAADITDPVTVLNTQLGIQREILAELRKTTRQQQAAANKAAAKKALADAKKAKGGAPDLTPLMEPSG